MACTWAATCNMRAMSSDIYHLASCEQRADQPSARSPAQFIAPGSRELSCSFLPPACPLSFKQQADISLTQSLLDWMECRNGRQRKLPFGVELLRWRQGSFPPLVEAEKPCIRQEDPRTSGPRRQAGSFCRVFIRPLESDLIWPG